MGLETGTYVSDLIATNPPGTDPKSQGDDHLRLIKGVLLNTFPLADGPYDAGRIPFTAVGAGAVQTTIGKKLGESVSVKDFGAKGDGTTDDTAAIQAAFDASEVSKSALYFPPGSYKISSSVTLDLRVSGSPALRRYVNLIGDGPDQSVILCTGSATTFVNVIGAFDPGVNNGEHKFLMEGISVQRPTADLIGTGLAVSLMTSAEFNNVYVRGFSTGATFTDLVGTSFNKCTWSYNITGAVLNKNLYSRANLSSFRDCHVSANRDMGMQIYGCNVLFESCGFESNGRTEAAYNAGYTAYSLWFQGSPDGYAALNMQNCYFEATKGIADVFIAALWTSSYSFEDCSFNRIDDTNYTINNILFDDAGITGSPEHRTQLKGCGFLSAGTYVQDVSRQKLVFKNTTGYTGWRISNLGGNIALDFGVDAYVPNYAQITAYKELVNIRKGFYTPIIIGDAGTEGAGSYNQQFGAWQKNGNLVTFQAIIGYNSHTGSGAMRATLPPITPDAIDPRYYPASLVWTDSPRTASDIPVAMIDNQIPTPAGTGAIRLYMSEPTGAITPKQMVAGPLTVYISGSYRAE